MNRLPPRFLSRWRGNREQHWTAHLQVRERGRSHFQHDRLALGRTDFHMILVVSTAVTVARTLPSTSLPLMSAAD